MNERVIPWGTVIAGVIAVGTAVIIGLVHIGGWTVPFQTAGPGAVIVVGVLIVLAGLLAVLRSNRSSAAGGTPAPAPDRAATPAAAETPLQTPPPPTHSSSQVNPEPVPAAQGAAEDLSGERSDGDAAQPNH